MNRRLWRRIHLILALAAAIPLLVAAVTGVLLAYTQPVERWLAPELYPQSGAGEPLPLGRVVAELRQAAPAATLHHVEVPHDPLGHYTVFASEPAGEGRDHYMLFVDPYSGEVVRRDGGGPLKLVERIHRNLLLDQPGRYLVAGASVALMLLSVVGLYLWWPMRGSTVRRFLRRRDALSWHNVAALITLPVLFIIAFTGVTLTFHKTMIPAINTLTGSPPLPEPPQLSAPATSAVALPQVLAAVQRAYPEHRITGFGDRGGARPYVVRIKRPEDAHPGGWQRVFVHPVSGELMGEIDAYSYSWGSAYQQSWYVWHTGQMLGGTGALLWSISCGALILLLITGLLLWLRRHRRPAPASPVAAMERERNRGSHSAPT